MIRSRFNVVSEIVDPESSVDGAPDVERIDEYPDGCSLRDAIDTVRQTRTSACDGVESVETDTWPIRTGDRVRWITINNGAEFETGCMESRTLFIPDSVSASSSRRIARLLGVATDKR